jgi:hypothetical protein
MKTRALKTMTGLITIAQEGRFKMEPENGQPMLFVLSPSSNIEPQDLGDLQRAQARLTVRYEESPDLIAGIAHDIGWADDSPSPTTRSPYLP